jgi:hypothetical protein
MILVYMPQNYFNKNAPLTPKRVIYEKPYLWGENFGAFIKD